MMIRSLTFAAIAWLVLALRHRYHHGVSQSRCVWIPQFNRARKRRIDNLAFNAQDVNGSPLQVESRDMNLLIA